MERIEEEEQKRRRIGFLDLLHILRKNIFLILISFIVVVAASIAHTALTTPQYTATVKLFATYSDDSGDANYTNINNVGSYINNQVQSYPTLATTPAVLNPAITALGWNMTASEMASHLTVTNPATTAFVNISYMDNSAKDAAAAANAVGASLGEVVEHSLYPGSNQSPIKLTIVQPAVVPGAPSSPNWKINIAFGVVAGLILGVLVSLLNVVLSKTIQDDEEVRDYVDAPTIGRIPEDEMLNNESPAVISEPGTPLAEDFRRIRTNLSFIAPVGDTNCRMIAITSTGASEGKTTITCNVAAALAENGAKVLLIDADLRHPSVAKKLGIDGSAGLAHVLSGQASVRDVVQRFWKSNLHIMPAGPKPPNASTLLNSPIMAELLSNALQQYDYVLVDTAPMVVANDAVTFVRKGGSLVMVCRRNQTQKRDLREISDELNTLDMQVSGIVFNCAKENKKALENSNYYYYSNQDIQRKKKSKRSLLRK